MKNNKVLVLRPAISYAENFKWPKAGKVVCPNWDPSEYFMGDFAGLLWGEGFFDLLGLDIIKKFLVLEVDEKKIIKADGFVKFPECNVIYSGSLNGASKIILKAKPDSCCPGSGKEYFYEGVLRGRCWYKDGRLHRELGPAIIYDGGEMYWYKKGKLHNDYWPAVYYPNGEMHWFKNGVKHRPDGPATISSDGKHQYWVEGERLTKKAFNKLVKSRESGV